VTPAELKAWRTGAGLDQGRLATALGVHRVTVNRWEQGRWPIPHHLGVLLSHLAEVPTRPARRLEDRAARFSQPAPHLERRADGWCVLRGMTVLARFGPGAEGHAAATAYLTRIQSV